MVELTSNPSFTARSFAVSMASSLDTWEMTVTSLHLELKYIAFQILIRDYNYTASLFI